MEEIERIYMNAQPWDIFNKDKIVDENISRSRMDICESCEFFIPLTTQCMKCGCFMTLKTKIDEAFCPIHKWNSVAPNRLPLL